MNWIDWAVLVVIALSAAVGLIRGLVKEAISTAMLIVAFWIAGNFHPQMAKYITSIQDGAMRDGAAMTILFIATLLIGALISHLVGKIVSAAGLTGINMVLGAMFGGLRGVIIVAFVVYILNSFGLAESIQLDNSRFTPHVNDVINWFTGVLEQNTNFQLKMP